MILTPFLLGGLQFLYVMYTHGAKMNWNMLWMKSTFKLPEGYREILIKCGDSIDLGYFDPSNGRFVLNNGSSFNCRNEDVEWMDLVTPEVICGREIFYS